MCPERHRAVSDAGIAVKFLSRDRSGGFGPGFDAVWQGDGTHVVRTPVRAPNASIIAERWVEPCGRCEQSAQTECSSS